MTKDIVEERGYQVDMAGFNAAEEQHSLVSGGGQAMGVMETADFYAGVLKQLQTDKQLPSGGVAYDPYDTEAVKTRVVALIQDGKLVTDVIVGEKIEVVLAATPFYVEAGGQVSDQGVIIGADWIVDVEDMKKPVPGLIVHIGEVVEGNPTTGDDATATINAVRRQDIIRNHTATHLLHAALRKHLGSHVQQRGSLVAPDRLRFDFAHDGRITPEELRKVETEVNDYVLKNYPVIVAEKTLAEARGEGAMALFGEKYGDRVRTITVSKDGDRYSYELCGGCHVSETAEIGPFVIIGEGSVSAGIRRVEALTGHAAVEYIHDQLDRLGHVAAQLNTTPEAVEERVAALQNELAQAKKQAAQLQRQLAKESFDALLGKLEQVNGKQALIAQVDDVPPDTLREMSDWFRNAVSSGVMVLGSVSEGKPQLVVAVTDDLTKQGYHAGNLIKQIAAVIGGGGGGRPTMAQAGGKDASKIGAALAEARKLLTN